MLGAAHLLIETGAGPATDEKAVARLHLGGDLLLPLKPFRLDPDDAVELDAGHLSANEAVAEPLPKTLHVVVAEEPFRFFAKLRFHQLLECIDGNRA